MERTFKEFVYAEIPSAGRKYTDMEVANMYFHNPNLTVREIAGMSGKSIGEMYRLLKRLGGPNRTRGDSAYAAVISLADSGMPVQIIADMTGYTSRHIRNILKKNG